MDDPVRLAIVGCGDTGRQHLAGLAELSRTSYMNLDLVAVCDPNRANADDLADEAHELIGERPAVFENIERMVREVDGLEAADCPTDTGSHHVAAARAPRRPVTIEEVESGAVDAYQREIDEHLGLMQPVGGAH
jgi:predicted dehydrogenase